MHPLANRGILGLNRNLLLVRRRSTYHAAFAIGLHYFYFWTESPNNARK